MKSFTLKKNSFLFIAGLCAFLFIPDAAYSQHPHKVTFKTKSGGPRSLRHDSGPGTDAKVEFYFITDDKMIIHPEKSWWNFDSSKDDFEAGNKDVMQFSLPHNGPLETMRIRMTLPVQWPNLFPVPDNWIPDWVMAENYATGAVYSYKGEFGYGLKGWEMGDAYQIIKDFELTPTPSVALTTGDADYAGSVAKVTVQIYGSRGNSPVKNCNKSDYDDRRRGRTDTYYIRECKDIGTPKTLVVTKSKKEGDKKGWNFTHGAINYKGKWYTTGKENVWLRGGDTKQFTLRPMTPYVVEIKTGDKKNAGTDAKVMIKLNGMRNSSDWILANVTDYNDRQRGKTNFYFVHERNDLGNIKSVEIKKNKDDNWLMESITVTRGNTKFSTGYVGYWFKNSNLKKTFTLRVN